MDSGKRVRCSNFINNEINILLTLVEEHKTIIGGIDIFFNSKISGSKYPGPNQVVLHAECIILLPSSTSKFRISKFSNCQLSIVIRSLCFIDVLGKIFISSGENFILVFFSIRKEKIDLYFSICNSALVENLKSPDATYNNDALIIKC